MEIEVTLNMLPDLLAFAALLTLAIYHLMIYWGRRKDADEVYNLYFAGFVLSGALFIIAPYNQPRYFLYNLKPAWLHVVNVEMFSTWLLFISGLKFLSLLFRVPAVFKKYFIVTYVIISIDLLLTLTVNFISYEFYAAHILKYILISIAVNILLIYFLYGYWIYRQKLFQDNFVRVFYLGFVLLVSNIFIYRTFEILQAPRVLIFNHYLTVLILYLFAYALSVKFNKEHRELKELKVNLEKKVADRTAELENSNRLLEERNEKIEKQKQEIIAINTQLEIRAEELKELDQVKSRFFTNISHEFRTPLTLIIGPLESLLRNTTEENLQNEFSLMLRQAKKLLSLINQLLELSKLQKGMLKLNIVKDDLNRFVRTLVSSYSSLARELNVALNYTANNSMQDAWFDKDKVEKILTNLISNALKFTPTGGKVDVIPEFEACKKTQALSKSLYAIQDKVSAKKASGIFLILFIRPILFRKEDLKEPE